MKDKFTEQATLVHNLINEFMTKDSSDDQIKQVAHVQEEFEKLTKEHEELVSAHAELKDNYIAMVKGTGSSKEPAPADGQEEPKSLEQLASELLTKK